MEDSFTVLQVLKPDLSNSFWKIILKVWKLSKLSVKKCEKHHRERHHHFLNATLRKKWQKENKALTLIFKKREKKYHFSLAV